MPSKSKAQQKFFGIVRSIQKGEAPKSKFSKSAQDAAKDMKKSDVKKYAKTKHKGLPNKVKQETKVQSLIRKMVREELEQLEEKCWKGYEKKGMKTMFGKRYPNCVKKEGTLDELTSFNVVKDRLVNLGFGNLVVSWRGTKKKVKDLNPDARLDYIMIEKSNNTLLKNKLMRYDGNNFKVTPQGKKYFKGTLQLEGKLTEGGKEIAKTILQQLGGNKFIAMTGAKNLGFTDKGIQMKIGRNAKGVTHVIIDLDRGKDLYNIEFVKVRGMKRTTVKKLKGIYADQLKKIFTQYTGLRVSL
jgi:hypothetical protein